MAFLPAELILADPLARLWAYRSTDAPSTVIAGTYLPDGQGLRVGDTLLVRQFTSAAFTALVTEGFYAVTATSASGVAALGTASAPGGSSGQMQVNIGGVLSGAAGTAWDGVKQQLRLDGAAGILGTATLTLSKSAGASSVLDLEYDYAGKVLRVLGPPDIASRNPVMYLGSGGGAYNAGPSSGSNGGSGGGSSGHGGGSGAGTGTGGQGSNGGNGNTYGGGGGGGATAAGSNGTGTDGGAGGAGTSSSISGSAVTYAGGGGGGAYTGSAGSGGSGGGGNGAAVFGSPANGTANTGGGGGGANNVSASPSGGNGGSGVVIVRYLT